MKKIIIGLLALGSISSFANTNMGIETDRELQFNLGLKDALKCGEKIIGDHLSTATVYKVTSQMENTVNIYYEVTDRSGYSSICKEANILKLTGYFDEIRGSVKLRNYQRIFQSRRNAIVCKLEKEIYKINNAQSYKYLVVKETYGQRELTPFFKNEITHEIYSDKGKKLTECDSFISEIPVVSETPTFFDRKLFDEGLKSTKENVLASAGQLHNHKDWDIGGCFIDLYEYRYAYYSITVQKKYLLAPPVVLGSIYTDRLIRPAQVQVLQDLLNKLSPEDCMIQESANN